MPLIDDIVDITDLNNGWGICGFVSALAAMYENTPQIKANGGGNFVQAAMTPTRMIAEIKSFLVTLQADNNVALINEIEAFTQTFDGFGGFTVQGYIDRVRRGGAEAADKGDDTWSIALPPAAVVEYLKKACGLAGARVMQPAERSPNAYIVGVKDVTDNKVMYNGLCHYMFIYNRRVISWRENMPNVKAADENFEVTHRITW